MMLKGRKQLSLMFGLVMVLLSIVIIFFKSLSIPSAIMQVLVSIASLLLIYNAAVMDGSYGLLLKVKSFSFLVGLLSLLLNVIPLLSLLHLAKITLPAIPGLILAVLYAISGILLFINGSRGYI